MTLKIITPLLAFVALTLVFSCDEENAPKETTCSVTKFISPGSSVTHLLSYDDNRRLSSIEYQYIKNNAIATVSTIMQYDASGKLIKFVTDNKLVTELVYDAKGKVVKDTSYAINGGPAPFSADRVKRYEYDTQERIVKVLTSNTRYARIEWDQNGNISKQYFTYNGAAEEFLELENLTLDGKKNPMLNAPFGARVFSGASGISRIETYYSPVQSKSNPVEWKVTDVTETTYSYSATMTYNDFGYPTSVVVDTDGFNNVPTGFEYSCQ